MRSWSTTSRRCRSTPGMPVTTWSTTAGRMSPRAAAWPASHCTNGIAPRPRRWTRPPCLPTSASIGRSCWSSLPSCGSPMRRFVTRHGTRCPWSTSLGAGCSASCPASTRPGPTVARPSRHASRGCRRCCVRPWRGSRDSPAGRCHCSTWTPPSPSCQGSATSCRAASRRPSAERRWARRPSSWPGWRPRSPRPAQPCTASVPTWTARCADEPRVRRDWGPSCTPPSCGSRSPVMSPPTSSWSGRGTTTGRSARRCSAWRATCGRDGSRVSRCRTSGPAIRRARRRSCGGCSMPSRRSTRPRPTCWTGAGRRSAASRVSVGSTGSSRSRGSRSRSSGRRCSCARMVAPSWTRPAPWTRDSRVTSSSPRPRRMRRPSPSGPTCVRTTTGCSGSCASTRASRVTTSSWPPRTPAHRSCARCSAMACSRRVGRSTSSR